MTTKVPTEKTVIVYTMSRSGSFAVRAALDELNDPGLSIYKSHNLIHEGIINKLRELLKISNLTPFQQSMLNQVSNATSVNIVVNRCRENQQAIHYITGIREPIANKISNMFRAIDHSFPDWEAELAEDAGTLVDKLCAFLIDSIQVGENRLQWFDENIRQYTGLDIRDMPFDKESGYGFFSSGPTNVFLYKQEHLGGDVAEGLSRYLERTIESIPRVNQASHQNISGLYLLVQNRIRFDAAFLGSYYEQSGISNFYSDQAIDGFIRHWSSDRTHDNEQETLDELLKLFRIKAFAPDTAPADKADFVSRVERKNRIVTTGFSDISLFLANVIAGNDDEAVRIGENYLKNVEFCFFIVTYLAQRQREHDPSKAIDAFLVSKMFQSKTEITKPRALEKEINSLAQICDTLGELGFEQLADEIKEPIVSLIQ